MTNNAVEKSVTVFAGGVVEGTVEGSYYWQGTDAAGNKTGVSGPFSTSEDAKAEADVFLATAVQ